MFVLTSGGARHTRAQTSDDEPRTIDTVRGVIRGSPRFIGLGGAFVAIADDTEGMPINPAAAAVRLPYSWNAFSFAFGIDFAVATWLPKNDIYNAPEGADSDGGSLFGSFAMLVNYRHGGFGVSAEAERNVVSQQAQGVSSKRTASFGLVRPTAAYGFLDGQLQLGVGLRVLGFSFDLGKDELPLTAGVGCTGGVIVKPNGSQFRIGAAIEQPISAEVGGERGTAPTRVHIPWTAAFGFAYQFGRRPLNPKFVTVGDRESRNTAGRPSTDEDEEKAKQELFTEYERDQTWYLLVSTELALIEGSSGASLDGSLGLDRTLVSPRLGLESEVVPRFLRLRAGTYLELATTEGGHSRLHGTGGVDVKLFKWDVFGLVDPFNYWQLSLAVDGARSYLNTSFSIGFWH